MPRGPDSTTSFARIERGFLRRVRLVRAATVAQERIGWSERHIESPGKRRERIRCKKDPPGRVDLICRPHRNASSRFFERRKRIRNRLAKKCHAPAEKQNWHPCQSEPIPGNSSPALADTHAITGRNTIADTNEVDDTNTWWAIRSPVTQTGISGFRFSCRAWLSVPLRERDELGTFALECVCNWLEGQKFAIEAN